MFKRFNNKNKKDRKNPFRKGGVGISTSMCATYLITNETASMAEPKFTGSNKNSRLCW